MSRVFALLMILTVLDSHADHDNNRQFLDIGYSHSNRLLEPTIWPDYGLSGNGEGFFMEVSFQPKEHFYWGAFLDRKESDIWFQDVALVKNTVVAKYGLFTGYQQNIRANLAWFGEVKLFRIDSGDLQLDHNGVQFGGGLQKSLSNQFILKGGAYLNRIRDTSGIYPTLDFEAVFRFNNNYRLRFNLQDTEGDLAGKIGLGYSF